MGLADHGHLRGILQRSQRGIRGSPVRWPKRREEFGALPRNSGFAAWVVVLFGGFLINGGYAAFLLTKNRTWNTFRGPGVGKAWSWSILTGLVWFAAFGLYGQGAALMGDMGPVIGWAIYVGLGLMVGTVWAILGGEWKGRRAAQNHARRHRRSGCRVLHPGIRQPPAPRTAWPKHSSLAHTGRSGRMDRREIVRRAVEFDTPPRLPFWQAVLDDIPQDVCDCWEMDRARAAGLRPRRRG